MATNPAVALFLALGVIILAARVAGGLARQIGQPRVLGELLVGVILGPTLLNMLHWGIFHGVELEETILELGELGVLMLMFIVGLEVDLRELLKVGKVAILAGVLGAFVPVLLTVPVVMAFGYTWQPALFAGVVLAATSVSISAQVLLEMGFLQTKEGSALLATALIDDILAILLVSVTIAVIAAQGGAADGGQSIPLIIGQMTLFLVVAFLIAWFAVPRLMNRVHALPSAAQSYGVAALAIVIMLFFAWAAEEMGGVATITGAFIAGLGISQAKEDVLHEVERAVGYIAYAFLVPVFFIDVGLQIDLSTFQISAMPLALLLIAVAVISKVGGCGVGARLGGFNNQEALRVGVCMISRGEVGLIIAALGVSTGILVPGNPLFVTLFLVILLTTVITPILVRQVFPMKEPEKRKGANA